MKSWALIYTEIRKSLNGGYVMKVTLERYHGLGNDYVVFDPNKNEL